MKKIFRFAPLVVLASFLFASCNFGLEDISKNENKAYIHIGVAGDSDNARTVLPYEYETENLNYELWGRTLTVSEDGKIDETIYSPVVKLASWLSYDSIKKSNPIEVSVGTWEFTLKAYKNNKLLLSDTIVEYVTLKTSKIIFNLTEVDGKGRVRFDLTVPRGFNTLYFKAGLYSTDDVNFESILYSQTGYYREYYKDNAFEITLKDDLIHVAYHAKSVDAGNYFIRFSICSDSKYQNELDSYTTLVKVVNDRDSFGEYTMKNVKYALLKPVVRLVGNKLVFARPSSKTSTTICYYYTREDRPVEDLEPSLFDTDTTYLLEYPIEYSESYNYYYAIKYDGESTYSNIIKISTNMYNIMVRISRSGIYAGEYKVQKGFSAKPDDYEHVSWDNATYAFYKLELEANTTYFYSGIDRNSDNDLYDGDISHFSILDGFYVYSENSRILCDNYNNVKTFTTREAGTYYFEIKRKSYEQTEAAFRIYTE